MTPILSAIFGGAAFLSSVATLIYVVRLVAKAYEHAHEAQNAIISEQANRLRAEAAVEKLTEASKRTQEQLAELGQECERQKAARKRVEDAHRELLDSLAKNPAAASGALLSAELRALSQVLAPHDDDGSPK